jgi:hypothetical protein
VYSPPPDNSVGPGIRVLAALAFALFGVLFLAIAWSALSADQVEVLLSDCSTGSGRHQEFQKLMCMVSNAFISSVPQWIAVSVEIAACVVGGFFMVYLAWRIWPKLDDTPSASN